MFWLAQDIYCRHVAATLAHELANALMVELRGASTEDPATPTEASKENDRKGSWSACSAPASVTSEESSEKEEVNHQIAR